MTVSAYDLCEVQDFERIRKVAHLIALEVLERDGTRRDAERLESDIDDALTDALRDVEWDPAGDERSEYIDREYDRRAA
jgi:hypothetical protein